MGSCSLTMTSRLIGYTFTDFWQPEVVTDKVLDNLLCSLVNVIHILVFGLQELI